MTYQMGDGVGGLVFLATVLISIAFVGVLIRRGLMRSPLVGVLLSLSGIWLCYAVAVVMSGILSTERIIPLGSTECFDDWCASVVSATSSGTTLRMEVRVTNEAKRAAQTPDHPTLVVIDSDGVAYAPVAAGPRALNSRVDAGETFVTTMQFTMGRGQATKVLLTEGSGPPLIGDQNSFFHKKTYIDVKQRISR